MSALKMQVAVKLVNDDEATIQTLRKMQEARKTAIIATKDLEEATALVQDLRLELGALKRKLGEVRISREEGNSICATSITNYN